MLTMSSMIELYAKKELMNKQKAKANLAIEIEENSVKKGMMPLEQIPLIEQSMSQMFQGSNLTFYKDPSNLMSGVKPMMDMITQALRPSPSE